MKKNNDVLKDHKKVGQRFIPPFLQSFKGWETTFKPVDIQKEIVPEIIWVSYLVNELGIEESAEVMYKFIVSIEQALSSEKIKDLCFLSSYHTLSERQIEMIRTTLRNNYYYRKVEQVLKGFNQILPQNPLNRIFLEIPNKNKSNIEKLKKTLNDLDSKRKNLFVFSVANIFMVKNKLGQFVIGAAINLPPPICIIDHPDTEESLRLAGFFRSSIYPVINNDSIISNIEWRNNFWNYTNQLEPIQITNIYRKNNEI